VGNDAARAIHGLSAGADLAVLGQDIDDAADLGLQEAEPGVQLLEVLNPVGTLTKIFPPAASALASLADLADLSDPALGAGARPMVVAVAHLATEVPALLDLLDKPGVSTGVATVRPERVDTGLERLTQARVGADGKLVESVGTASHVVTRPNLALPGLLRVGPGERAAAAIAWREAATALPYSEADPFALAVLALVRSGVPVQAVPMGPFAFSRGKAGAKGAPGGPWEQRLAGASRGGDGFVSTFAIRPLSRRVTGMGLRLGWSPNAVTVVSLALGVLAAVLVATGNRGLWVLAAVVLQAALVVDCVDGEIARFTRRFSAFGAWLDAVGDRVKEYSVYAALAVVAARAGHPAWTLAVVAMAVVTVRHLEDYAYENRLQPVRRSRPDIVPIGADRDGGPMGDRTAYPDLPSTRQTVVHWVKKVIHMPIAERYTLISLGLLTGSPRFVLWLLIVTVALSVIWTQGGRVVKALSGRDGVPPAVARGRWGHLDVQLDLGPVARLTGRVFRLPFLPAALALLLLTVAAVAMVAQHATSLALIAVLLSALVMGAGARPPVSHLLDWQLPAMLWLMEAVVTATVGQVHLATREQGLTFAYLAAVAYHRYDVVYRLRDTGKPAAAWLSLAGLGVEGRLLAILAVAALSPERLPAVLGAGTVWLGVLYLTESAAGWRRWITAQRPGLPPEPVAAPAPAASPHQGGGG
jgi:phosphatidylglycerophosphate synthase